MKGWLKRNAIALGAIVVLIPATVGLTFSAQWLGYFASRPSQPQVVAVHQSTEYGNSTWTVTDSTRIEADTDEGRAAQLPAGTSLIVVHLTTDPIRVDKDGLSAYCSIELNELDGDTITRTWNTGQYQPIEYDDGGEVGCNTDYQSEYAFETYFVVPSDAGTDGTDGTDLALGLATADELPNYLRLYF
jgi:hypothetical protein